jgi:NADPH:quinone reductase-like Zn-dependent oxidoreductase
MHAAVVHTLGESPRFQEFADPTPNPDEVLIRVHAAGLHPIVKALASGSHYSAVGAVPMVAGIDAVGTRSDGSRIYCGGPRRPWGTMAELCAVPAAMCLTLPDGIDDLQAAAIANPGMSAMLSLKERAGLMPGETALILGATGVAGQLAIQLARFFGAARVVAAGRNVEALADAPVDAIIPLGEPEDKVREAFAAEASKGIDVILDYLWGRPTELLLDALIKGFSPRGSRPTRLVEVGESAGKSIQLPGAALRSIDLKLMGSGFGSVALDRVLKAIPDLFSMAAQGKLKVAVDPVSLTEVESAWTQGEKGRRIVFTV